MKKMTAINEKKHEEIIKSFNDEATMKLSQCEKIIKGIEKIS